jgi:uncharacterized protein (TIGR00661 family)
VRILFGVQTTGNGHISRSRELVRELKELGHDVRVLLSGRDPSELRELEVFEPWTAYRGLSFTFAAGKVRFLNTTWHAPRDLMRVWRDVAAFDARGYDLVITDFEPVTARVAKRHGIPSMGFGHQYAFVFDVPMVRSDPMSKYILMRMGFAEIPLGLHWHHFNFPILPPVVPGYLKAGETVANKVLVYLPFESIGDIVAKLSPLTSYDFFIYGTGISPGDRGNLHQRAYSRDGFLQDLSTCDAVVCNAGFELPGEALHLGKRLLVKPLHGQLEQGANAQALVELNMGQMMQELDTAVIAAWLETSPRLAPMNYPGTARGIARWIDAGKWDTLDVLSRELWKDVPIGSRESGVGS